MTRSARALREVPAADGAQQKDLLPAGAHRKGGDPRAGLAIAVADAVNAFLRQGTAGEAPPASAPNRLRKMF